MIYAICELMNTVLQQAPAASKAVDRVAGPVMAGSAPCVQALLLTVRIPNRNVLRTRWTTWPLITLTLEPGIALQDRSCRILHQVAGGGPFNPAAS